ncbi:MAG: hypothetical protein R6W73_01825 [Candidatus Saliniplasma sp.]
MLEKRWNLRKRIAFVLLVGLFTIPLLIMLEIPELYIIILFSVLLGSVTWLFAGILTPSLIGVYIKLHNKFNGFFGVTREISILKNKKYSAESFWDIFYKSLSEALFPTIIAFTVAGYILKDVGTVNNPNVFLVLIFGPVIVSFLIPIRILQDSKLYYIDRRTKEVISLCRELNMRLKSVGGVVALGLFLLTLYTISGDIQETLLNLVVYFSFTYPTITITSYFYYDRWHRGFIADVNRKGRYSGLERIAIGIFRD